LGHEHQPDLGLFRQIRDDTLSGGNDEEVRTVISRNGPESGGGADARPGERCKVSREPSSPGLRNRRSTKEPTPGFNRRARSAKRPAAWMFFDGRALPMPECLIACASAKDDKVPLPPPKLVQRRVTIL